jgi:multisubunit Na+/H+ antiporter MnhG subunit
MPFLIHGLGAILIVLAIGIIFNDKLAGRLAVIYVLFLMIMINNPFMHEEGSPEWYKLKQYLIY